ncbi:MAG: preprotein translocase subunit SecG [Deferribacteres bacterium]|nr:preprotein translocase subunit SecG [candidate division KSB1 bacterium]MCB9500772.1 preprotein translocase subunit SecG [Deferribacteres bacterium]
MYTLILVLFLLVCLIMTIVILLQSSKGGGLAGAFGGGGNMGNVFGGRGAATFLSRTTTWLAVAFFLLAFLLSKMDSGSSEATGSVVAEELENVVNTPSAILPPVQESVPAAGSAQSQTTGSQDSTK